MDRQQARQVIIEAARKEAASLLKSRRRYPHGRFMVCQDGEAVCAFGAVLERAHLLSRLGDGTFISNIGAFAAALEMKIDDVPEHVHAALSSISHASDNEDRWSDVQRRRRVADALRYFADVLQYADLPA